MNYVKIVFLLLINLAGYYLFHLARRLCALLDTAVRSACSSLKRVLERGIVRDVTARQRVRERHDDVTTAAQVLKIWARYRFDVLLSPCSSSDFIATHERHCAPEYVLQDHVTLYAVSATEAVFVETSADVDVHSSDCNAFFRVGQFLNARRLIRMPLTSLYNLAAELLLASNDNSACSRSLLADPAAAHNDATADDDYDEDVTIAAHERLLLKQPFNKKLVFISMTGRCGSTLLLQLFEGTGRRRTLTLSEPDVLNSLAQLERHMTATEHDLLIKSCVLLLCKPRAAASAEAAAVHTTYVIKLVPPTIHMVPKLHRLFPTARHVFTYRQGLDVAKSSYRIAEQMPLILLLLLSSKLPSQHAQRMAAAMGVPRATFADIASNDVALFYYFWSFCVRAYHECRRRCVDIAAVKYEHLLANPRRCARQVFDHCAFACSDAELDDIVPRVTSRDSQMASPLSHDIVSRCASPRVSTKDIEVMNEIARQNGVPGVAETCQLDGTITHL